VRPLRGFVTLCALFAVSGCGSDGSSSVAEDPSGTPDAAAGPEVTCGSLSWPVSAMDGGVDGLIDDAEVDAALAAVAEEAPMDAPEAEPWIALAAGESAGSKLVILGVGPWSSETGPGAGALSVALESTETGWKVASWGDCQLHVALPAGRTQVELTAPDGGVDGNTTAPTVMVNERECTSGRDPNTYLGEPEVTETADTVSVFLTSESAVGDQNCQGNPSVPLTLELAEPIGDRELVDGGTWPPRPIQVG
jgi:hypothetical protein